MTLADLLAKRSVPGAAALSAEAITTRLALLPGWERVDKAIFKTYRFADYYETTAFANAIAWVAHRQDHHPDLEVSYNRCRVSYSTHDAGGLTDNDFVCAARVEALLT